jgi:hypothetical protein
MKFVSAAHLTGGGTITGDLTISGDLTVSGGGGFAYSEVLTGDLSIDQDANAVALIIDSEATSSNIIHISSPVVNSGHIISIVSADALTTGSAIRVDCGSTALASTSSGGLVEILHDANSTSNVNNLLYIHNDHASSTGTTGLHIQQDSTGSALTITGGNYSQLQMISSGAENGIKFVDSGGAVDGYLYATGSSIGFLDSGTNQRFKIDDNSRISLSNNDAGASGAGANTIFGKLAGAGVADGALYNVLIGEEAGNDLTVADHNTVIGYQAFDKVTTSCDGNVAIGYQSMHGVVSDNADNCVFIGKNTCNAAIEVTAAGAVGIGFQALKAIVDGAGATAVGYNALTALTTGSGNTAVGYNSLLVNNVGYYNTALGYDTLKANVSGAANTAVGYFSLMTNTGNNNTSVGYSSLKVNAAGSRNTAVGQETLFTNASTHDNTSVGYQSGYLTTGADNTYVGAKAGYGASGAESNNVGVGSSALLAVTTGSSNVAIGKQAMLAATACVTNIAIGQESLKAIAVGEENNIAIGVGAMYLMDEGTAGGDIDNNIAIGRNAFIGGDLTSNDRQVQGNIAIGYQALDATGVNAQTGTIAIGFSALTALTSGAGNTAVGYTALMTEDVGVNNTAIGYKALTVCDNDTGMNTAVGSQAGLTLDAGNGNTLIGHNAAKLLTAGVNNVAIGLTALRTAALGESTNIAIGGNAMYSVAEHSGGSSSANGNIAIGQDAMTGGALASGENFDYNIAIGENAMNSTGGEEQTGTIAIGHSALTALTSGAANTAIGYQAGLGHTTGGYNTIVGYGAMDGTGTGSTSAGSNHNTAVGYYAAGGAWANEDCANIVAIGSNSLTGALEGTADGTVAIGAYSLYALTSGAGNTAVGYGSMDELVDGNRNTALGYNSMGDVVGGTTSDGSNDNVFIGWNSGGGTWLDTASPGNTVVGSDSMSGAVNGVGFCSIFGFEAGKALNGSRNSCFGYRAGDGITTGTFNLMLGVDTEASAVTANYQIAIGFEATGNQDNGTVIGRAGIFQFASKEYTCDHADAEDGKSAASEASPLKLPAYSIIKSISVIVKTLSNLGTYNVALYHSTDTAAPADDTALGGTPVEVLGAGASDTCSGNSASAVDIALGSGTVLKQSYYNAYGGAGLPVGTADRYIHVGQAGTGNGDTDPSTAGVIKVLVEYVGLD